VSSAFGESGGGGAAGGGYASNDIGQTPLRGIVYATHALLQGDTAVGWQVAVSSTGNDIPLFAPEAICMKFGKAPAKSG
jgi:hypothetical protein